MQDKFTILLASDHSGFKLKNALKNFLKEEGYQTEDLGAFEYDSEDDYPDFISLASEKISNEPNKYRAIILGASGQGEAIVANRYKNVRAVVYNCVNLEIIKLAREHNDSNILSLGAIFLSNSEAQEAVKLWLETPFSEEARHIRRIEKIEN